VPAAYREWFAHEQAVLQSHRGWDPGALALARQMAAALGAPLFASTTTRLLVDLNRSVGHAQLFSSFTRHLDAAQRHAILQRYYRPHRDAVEHEIARRIAAGQRVVHVALHSFTPVWDGVDRRTDVAWLYDPRRAAETAFAKRWRDALRTRAPDLRLRCNYPYQGRSDGLTASMRRAHGDARYVGLELEVSQAWAGSRRRRWSALRGQLIQTLREALV